jgi:exodeoxyribonuclease-3
MGYQAYWHPAQKKGYSGVATLTRIAPTHVEVGCGMDAYDAEGRVLTTHLPSGIVVLNVYMPSGTSGDERQSFKYQWLADFLPYAKNLASKHSKVIICGDFNIAHTEKDIKNAASNKNSSGFLPEERAWLTSFLEAGFTDTFRAINPDKQDYSWWTFRAGARERNIGWRIDYIMSTSGLHDSLKHARMAPEAVHSDHCPVILELH